MTRIGVLISGGGSNLQALMDNCNNGFISADIAVVISDRSSAYGLVRAQESGIPTRCIEKKDYKDDQAYNIEILKTLKNYNVDIVVLAGYLSILNKAIIEEYKNKIINVHPSLIPSFCGMGYYGNKVHKAVIEYGVKVSGATVHIVDEGADTGPIILQKPVMIDNSDDAVSLARKVLAIEHELLSEAVKLMVDNKIVVKGRKANIRQ